MSFSQVLKLVVFITLISVSAMAESKSGLTEEVLEKAFQNELKNLTADQKDLIYRTDAYLQRTEGFVNVKSSGKPVQKVGILCVQAKAGVLLLKGGGSICRTGGENPQFHLMGIATGGIAVQWMTGAYLGVVETRTGKVDGKYEVLSIGFSPGLAAEMLFAENETRKFFLVGIGVGFGFEISGGTLILQPITRD